VGVVRQAAAAAGARWERFFHFLFITKSCHKC
jgi:hypothetical protein